MEVCHFRATMVTVKQFSNFLSPGTNGLGDAGLFVREFLQRL
jgi:hypothetical protein